MQHSSFILCLLIDLSSVVFTSLLVRIKLYTFPKVSDLTAMKLLLSSGGLVEDESSLLLKRTVCVISDNGRSSDTHR